MEITKLQFDHIYPKIKNCECEWIPEEGRCICRWCMKSINYLGCDPYKSVLWWMEYDS